MTGRDNGQSVFVIAEVGQASDGSLGILHSYIDALSKTGVDAVKYPDTLTEPIPMFAVASNMTLV